MTLTTPVIRKWYERPEPLPTDFIWTKTFLERTSILKKEEGVAVSVITPFGGGGGPYATRPAYFIFVMTQHGDMRIIVSERVFDLLRDGDPIVVSYRRGRWSGALKGKIAR